MTKEFERRRLELSELSSRELVLLATQTDDEDETDLVLSLVQSRGGETELAAALELSVNSNPKSRSVAAQILGGLGDSNVESRGLCVRTLRTLLGDHDPTVVATAIEALGKIADDSTIQDIVSLEAHDNEHVRLEVALALGVFESDAALQSLVRLSNDPDAEIREWATFGIADQSECSSDAVLAVLNARAVDEDAEVRARALVGLAKRGDSRAAELISSEIASECALSELFTAAIYVRRDPRLKGLMDWFLATPEGKGKLQVENAFRDARATCEPRRESDS